MPKTVKQKVGRPLRFKNPKELQEQIDLYFENEKMPTLAGLAYFIGINRDTLYRYEAKDEFSDTIKKARDRMLQEYERLLIYGRNATGVIFALKNTGWTDKQDTEHSGNVTLKVVYENK